MYSKEFYTVDDAIAYLNHITGLEFTVKYQTDDNDLYAVKQINDDAVIEITVTNNRRRDYNWSCWIRLPTDIFDISEVASCPEDAIRRCLDRFDDIVNEATKISEHTRDLGMQITSYYDGR